MTSSDGIAGSVRIRLFLDGQLVQDDIHEIARAAQLRELAERHSSLLLRRAQEAGVKWLVEVEVLTDADDPDRFLRFGTDTDGMRDPIPFKVE